MRHRWTISPLFRRWYGYGHIIGGLCWCAYAAFVTHGRIILALGVVWIVLGALLAGRAINELHHRHERRGL